MGGAKTTEAVTLHGTGETLTLGDAGDVDELAGDEVFGRQLGADVDHVVGRHAELDHLGLRLDLGDREVAAHGLGRVLDLGHASAELDGGVAVLFLGPLSNNLAVVQLEDGDRDVLAGVVVDPGHPNLLCNHT